MKKQSLIISIIIIGLCLLTIFLIMFVSSLEKNYYTINESYELVQKSYGEPNLIIRSDISEVIELTGVYTSNEIIYVPFDEYNSEDITFFVESGQEIQKGDVLFNVNTNSINSEYNAIVKSIDYTNEFISLYNLDNLVFETIVGIDFDNTELSVQNTNEILTLKNVSNIVEDGGRKALFTSSEEYLYGEEVTYYLLTGITETNVLMVSVDCVYEVNEQFYIRVVDQSGYFIEEIPVKTGISDGLYISISDGEEGTYCDSGYSSYISSFE